MASRTNKPAFTNSAVKPFKEWEDEAKRVKRRAADAKTAEAAEATPELITDPVTGEQREAPVATAKPEVGDWKDWDDAEWPAKPPVAGSAEPVDTSAAATITSRSADVAESVKAEKFRAMNDPGAGVMRADEAAALARARASGEKSRAEKAVRDARDEELRLALAADARAKAAAVPEQPEEELSAAELLLNELREAAATGQVGRLGPDSNRLTSLVNQFAGTGSFARDGRQSAAGVFTLGREVNSLGVLQQLPTRGDVWTRTPLSISAELDDPAGIGWLRQQVALVRETPSWNHLPIMVVVPAECEPADLRGLKQLAADMAAAVVLLGDDEGWKPVD